MARSIDALVMGALRLSSRHLHDLDPAPAAPGNKEKTAMVQAKFRVQAIKHLYSVAGRANEDQPAEITMQPVWEQDGPNKTWSEATPQGSLVMLITNAKAISEFEIGRAYVLSFEKVDG